MITIVNYGLGNIAAFANVYSRLGIPFKIAESADALDGSSKLILPGVGHFDHAMTLLDESGMRQRLDDLVLHERVPVLGICVGAQMLARTSEEGVLPGLGWVKADVKAFKSWPPAKDIQLPHMGWNDVRPVGQPAMFNELEISRFYFLHSYFIHVEDPADILAVSEYGAEFCCAVRSGNVYGVQFHPEKSHHFGTKLLKNFSEL